jgi:OmpA-OmpF porin, OOP family
MNKLNSITVCLAAWAALTLHTPVHAGADTKQVTGPYIGAAFGPAFGNREIDDSQSRNDEGLGRGAKIFGGYQITENFGVQVGYVQLHRLNQNTGTGATLVKQTVTGHSAYAAGTGRLPLGASFALTGKLGVSFGNVTAANPNTTATQALQGSKTALLVGTGVEYALNPHVLIALELESYGQMSSRVKGNSLCVGTRFTF